MRGREMLRSLKLSGHYVDIRRLAPIRWMGDGHDATGVTNQTLVAVRSEYNKFPTTMHMSRMMLNEYRQFFFAGQGTTEHPSGTVLR